MSSISSAARFEEEPFPPLRFVDPCLDEAGGGDVAMLVADFVGFPQPGG